MHRQIYSCFDILGMGLGGDLVVLGIRKKKLGFNSYYTVNRAHQW